MPTTALQTEPSIPTETIFLMCVHGIGQQYEKYGQLKRNVAKLKRTVQEVYEAKYGAGGIKVEIITIEWHSVVHKLIEPQMNAITLKTCGGFRVVCNEYFSDPMLYYTRHHSQKIVDHVVKSMNAAKREHAAKTPTFKGRVAFLGYSLGGIICWDILSNHNKKVPAAQKNLFKLKVPMLEFEVMHLQLAGSPMASCLVMRGQDFLNYRPSCSFSNVFHPFDPIAYRMEPLVHPWHQNNPPCSVSPAPPLPTSRARFRSRLRSIPLPSFPTLPIIPMPPFAISSSISDFFGSSMLFQIPESLNPFVDVNPGNFVSGAWKSVGESLNQVVGMGSQARNRHGKREHDACKDVNTSDHSEEDREDDANGDGMSSDTDSDDCQARKRRRLVKVDDTAAQPIQAKPSSRQSTFEQSEPSTPRNSALGVATLARTVFASVRRFSLSAKSREDLGDSDSAISCLVDSTQQKSNSQYIPSGLLPIAVQQPQIGERFAMGRATAHNKSMTNDGPIADEITDTTLLPNPESDLDSEESETSCDLADDSPRATLKNQRGNVGRSTDAPDAVDTKAMIPPLSPRLDFVLHEQEVGHVSMEYLLGIRAHFSYWSNRDFAQHLLSYIIPEVAETST